MCMTGDSLTQCKPQCSIDLSFMYGSRCDRVDAGVRYFYIICHCIDYLSVLCNAVAP